jgi:hypothetical protein
MVKKHEEMNSQAKKLLEKCRQVMKHKPIELKGILNSKLVSFECSILCG